MLQSPQSNSPEDVAFRQDLTVAQADLEHTLYIAQADLEHTLYVAQADLEHGISL